MYKATLHARAQPVQLCRMLMASFVSRSSLAIYYLFFFFASYLPLVRRKLAQEAIDPQELQ